MKMIEIYFSIALVVMFVNASLCVHVRCDEAVVLCDKDFKSLKTEEKISHLDKLDFINETKECKENFVLDAMFDKDNKVALAAIIAAGKIKDIEFVKSLTTIMSDDGFNWYLQIEAAKSLANIGAEESIYTIAEKMLCELDVDRISFKHINRKSVGWNDEMYEIQIMEALFIIAEKNKDVGLLFISKRLEDKDVKNNKKKEYYIAIVLGKLGSKHAVPYLIECLSNSLSGKLRSISAKLLGDLGDKTAIPALKKALKDNYISEPPKDVRGKKGTYTVRMAAWRALLKLGVEVEKNGEEYTVKE